MIFPDCSCRFFLHLLESKSSFSKIPNLNIKSAMKLTGPFNQLRSFLPSKVGASGYRFLCIFMAALLFCGMNSQVMAASVVPGANNDFNNNAPASGDKFNSESFLKASNPNADDNQHWTWGEEIGAGILGAALLGGAVVGGYKCYQGRQEMIRRQQRHETAGYSTFFSELYELHNVIEDRRNSESLAVRSTGMAKATDKTIAVTTATAEDIEGFSQGGDATRGWTQIARDSLTCLRRGAWRLGQGAYDLMTLKSCRSAASAEKLVAQKSLMEHLTEVRTAQLKTELATEKANRSWSQFAWNLLTLKPDVLPSDETAMQKMAKGMAPLGKRLATQLTASEKHEQYLSYLIAKDKKAAAIKDLNYDSSLHDILATLDPEMKDAIQQTLQKYAGDNNERVRAFAYFIAKNEDEWHPGHLLVLNTAFDNRENDLRAKIIVNTMNEAVQERWNHGMDKQ